MASMWRRAMLYLGLGPDEEYEDFDVTDEHQRQPARQVSPRPAPTPNAVRDREPTGSVRTLSPSPAGSESQPNGESNGARQRAAGAGATDRSGATRPRPAARPVGVAPSSKPHVVAPASFDDAQEVADRFKVNVPVILNLQGVDRDLARRIIDFASGLCYGLGGQMERVANQVYLLTPTDVEVSVEERRRLHARGYEADRTR